VPQTGGGATRTRVIMRRTVVNAPSDGGEISASAPTAS